MSGLPSGWASVPLDEVFEPRSTRVSPGDFPDLPYIGLEQVEAQTGKLLGTVPASSMSSSAAVFRAGDVLYGRMRPYLNKVLQPQFDGLASAEFIVFPALRGIDNRFIRSRLSASDFVEFACSQYEGDRPRVKFDQLGKFQLALPPAAEQTRIVEKLEELLSDLDAGVAELKAAQKKLAQYRQSLLKAAVEGALTAEWRQQHPPAETGAQLLQRILAERRARWEARQLAKFKEQGKTPPKDWQKKYPEPVQPDPSGLPELPQGWVWTCLDALIEEGPQNGLYLPASQYGKGVPILRIDDYQIGWHRSRSALNLVDADEKTAEMYALRVRDLVINRVNSMTHLGKSLCIGEAMAGVLFESNMMRLRLSEHVTADYVAFYLGSDVGRERLTNDAKWAVNQASINQQDVKKTPIPFPSQSEQQEIAHLLSSHHEAMERQLTAIGIALKQSTAQRQNILRAAFAGQLVPQDPADEPASVLLERIRAERAAKEVQKRPRNPKKEPA